MGIIDALAYECVGLIENQTVIYFNPTDILCQSQPAERRMMPEDVPRNSEPTY
jgi:hypothetical protein